MGRPFGTCCHNMLKTVRFHLTVEYFYRVGVYDNLLYSRIGNLASTEIFDC